MKRLFQFFNRRKVAKSNEQLVSDYEQLSSTKKASAQNLKRLLDAVSAVPDRYVFREITLHDFSFFDLKMTQLITHLRTINRAFKSNTQMVQEDILTTTALFNHDVFLSNEKNIYIDVSEYWPRLLGELQAYTDNVLEHESSDNTVLSYNVRILTGTTFKLCEFMNLLIKAQNLLR